MEPWKFITPTIFSTNNKQGTVFIHIKAGLKYTQGLKYTPGSAAEWKK